MAEQTYTDFLIEDILDGITVGDSRVHINKYNIWLCGGVVNPAVIFDGHGKPTLREFLLYYNKVDSNIFDSFFMAESFKDYYLSGSYKDLLDFENDIAEFASLIVILLESPGTLVEFGMFCNNYKYLNKLLVVVPAHEVDAEDSFIFWGPIQNLKRKDSSSVVIYPWPINDNYASYEDTLSSIYSDITKKFSKLIKTQIFDISNSFHICCLIVELVSTFDPLSARDIRTLIFFLGIDLTKDRVTNYLYLLLKFGVISERKYSNNKYYSVLSKISDVTFKFNSVNAKMKARRFLIEGKLKGSLTEADRKRLAVLKLNEIAKKQES